MSNGSGGSGQSSQHSSRANVYGGSHPVTANGHMPSAYYMTPSGPAPAAPPGAGGLPVKGPQAHKTWSDEEGAEGSGPSFCTRFKFAIWLATVLLLVRRRCCAVPALFCSSHTRLHNASCSACGRPALAPPHSPRRAVCPQICAAVGLSVTMAVVMNNRNKDNSSPPPSPDPVEPDSGGGGDGSGGDGNTGALACPLRRELV